MGSIAILLLLVGQSHKAEIPTPAELFPAAVQMAWLYEKDSSFGGLATGYGLTVTRRIDIAKGTALEVSTSDAAKGAKTVYQIDDKGVYMLSSGPGQQKLSSPMPLLVAPLKPGQKWSWKGTLPVQDGLSQGSMEAKVVGWEQLTVLGKEIDCLKIESKSKIGSGKAEIKVSRTSWYAPGIGLVKEHSDYNFGKQKLSENINLTQFSAPK